MILSLLHNPLTVLSKYVPTFLFHIQSHQPQELLKVHNVDLHLAHGIPMICNGENYALPAHTVSYSFPWPELDLVTAWDVVLVLSLTYLRNIEIERLH